jgi:hypothetical protein
MGNRAVIAYREAGVSKEQLNSNLSSLEWR